MSNLISEEGIVPDAPGNAPDERFAYIKEITQEEASTFAELDSVSSLPAGARCFAVRTEEGKMIGITDSWAAAYWAALSNDFSPLSVH
jgi:hypothetical protein